MIVSLLALCGVAAVPPASAGDADQGGVLTAAIYDNAPVPLDYIESWSQYGFSRTFGQAPVGGSVLYGVNGSPVITTHDSGVACDSWSDGYNAWFTYRAVPPGGYPMYVTVSISGMRRWDCGVNLSYPRLDVYFTTVAPPPAWRFTGSPPPNLMTDPPLSYTHNVPYLYDQTIDWVGSGPGTGTPAIVSLGDSTISGEGGRWAGNTDTPDYSRVDAGAQSYWDTPSGESMPTCHRSQSAEVHIGGGVLSQNFACSGAETHSYYWQYPQGIRFKPGVDAYCEVHSSAPTRCASGQEGQLLSLEQYAATHDVTAVVMAVGANDFGFSDVWKQCALIYEAQHVTDTGERCYNSGVIQAAITPARVATVQRDIFSSLAGVTAAMAAAGYDRSQYTVILQNYWSPIPDDEDIRIPDDYYRRQIEGGCPLLYGDASALNDVLLPAINDTVLQVARRAQAEPFWPKVRLLDVSGALDGHRLCEKGVDVIESYPDFHGNGTDPSMVDRLEWVTQARFATVLGAPYTLAEGGHANYWGQLAERDCLRQAYHQGSPVSGTCVPDPAGGVDAQGEPRMDLRPLATPL